MKKNLFKIIFIFAFLCSFTVFAETNSEKVNASTTITAGSRPNSAKQISGARVDFIAKSFKNSLKKNGARGGAVCIVQNGKILKVQAWDFPTEDESKKIETASSGQKKVNAQNISMRPIETTAADRKNAKLDDGAKAEESSESQPKFLTADTPLPLGKTSLALISLYCATDKKINLDKPVYSFCSRFKFGAGRGGDVTLRHLLSKRSGLPKSADKLVPADLQEGELFEMAAQISPAAAPDLIKEDSALGVQLACEAIAYASEPNSKNFKKTFLRNVQKNLFAPLDIKNVRLCDAKNPLFFERAFAISANDIAKWLVCETSTNPKNFDAAAIAERRISTVDFDRSSMGWLASVREDCAYFVAGDDFCKTANIVAVFPQNKCGVAFFAVGEKSAKCPQICAAALEQFTSMFSTPTK